MAVTFFQYYVKRLQIWRQYSQEKRYTKQLYQWVIGTLPIHKDQNERFELETVRHNERQKALKVIYKQRLADLKLAYRNKRPLL